jgi:transcriptional regulator with XRE-family HTH domain
MATFIICQDPEVSKLKKIKEHLKQIRQLKGLKQKEMAKLLGLSSSAYSKIEKGTIDLTLKNLFKIAKIFDDVSMDWFLTGDSTCDYRGFGKYAEDVREMIIFMEENRASMHSILSYFYQLKEKQEIEKELDSQSGNGSRTTG